MTRSSIPSIAAGICLIATSAAAQGDLTAVPAAVIDPPVLPNASIADLGGFPAVLHGLAKEMRSSAEHLRAPGARHRATEALDRALHLAEFGAHADGLGPASMEPFRAGLAAVEEARHALQNGAPEAAAEILTEVGAELSEREMAAYEAPTVEPSFETMEGLPVLNERGHHMGELERFEDSEEGALAVVAHGGFLGLGEKEESIPVEALLISDAFIVLPSPVEPKEFGTLDLVRTE